MISSNHAMGLGSGIVLVVFGIVLFAFPVISMSIFATIVGFGILVMGISSTVMWFRNLRGTGSGTGVLVSGILSIIFGFFCLLEPFVFAEAMTWVIAVAVIVFGIVQLFSIMSLESITGRSIGIGGTIVVILFGICALIWPTFIMQFMGASLFVEGLMVIIMSVSSPSPQAR